MITRIHVLVEGYTEAAFVSDVLSSYLSSVQLQLNPVIQKTLRTGSRTQAGGYVTYARLRHQVQMLLHDASAIAVTTMLDYYALPGDFPGRNTVTGATGLACVEQLEARFAADVDDRKFVPYLQLHEYEALLFVVPEVTAAVIGASTAAPALARVRQQFINPEEIDNDPITSPSKRLIGVCPEYVKLRHGPLAAAQAGIETLRNDCPHFNKWIERLEQLGRRQALGA